VELDQATKLGGVLNPVLRLAEDHWDYNYTETEFGKDVAIAIRNFGDV